MTYHHDAFEAEDFDAETFSARAGETGWGTPDTTLLGTNRRPAPPFPTALLGPFWADWASKAAGAASAPVDYPAGALLAAIGAMIANVRWPVAGSGWSEPPHLWVALVGSPSSSKSPGMEAAFSLLRHAEDVMAEGFDAQRRDYETRKAAAKADRDLWEADIKAARKDGKAPPPMPPSAEEPDAPTPPRIRVADSTIEKLGTLAAALPRGILLARDELAGWVANFDRYGGSGADRAFYLEAYGGRSYRVDRMKNQDPINIRHLSIGVLGTTQPDRLSLITGGADDGLASRLIWLWPEAAPRFKLARETLDDTPARYAFNRLLRLSLGSDEFGRPEPVRLRLAKDAENIIEEFAQGIQDRAEAVSGVFAGSLGKARGQALRLATVLEFLWWCGGSDQREPDAISHEAVVRACALVQSYLIPMAERVCGDAAIPAPERNAMALARHLRREKVRQFNARTVARTIGGELRVPEKMDAATALLVEAGLIRRQPYQQATGRAAKNYEVHPVVYGRP